MPERYRHKKRGTTYEVIGKAEVQAEADALLTEAELAIVYRSEQDGSLWVRRSAEFHDGRFERLDPTPPAPAAEDAVEQVARAIYESRRLQGETGVPQKPKAPVTWGDLISWDHRLVPVIRSDARAALAAMPPAAEREALEMALGVLFLIANPYTEEADRDAKSIAAGALILIENLVPAPSQAGTNAGEHDDAG